MTRADRGRRDDPARPLVVVLGGAKVTDKVGVIDRFLEIADQILIGGAMCFSFFRAQGIATGDSLVEEEGVELAGEALRAGRGVGLRARSAGRPGARASASTPRPSVARARRGRGARRLDGPRHRPAHRGRLRGARSPRRGTVFWNGPMGAFELEPFAAGTRAVAEAVAAAPGTTVVGGGDSVAALHAVRARRAGRLALDRRRSIVGADGGKELPGVEALMDADKWDRASDGLDADRTPSSPPTGRCTRRVAEAAGFVDALLPRIAATRAVDVVICPPFTGARARWSSGCTASARQGRRPEHARGAAGAFTGEVSAPMLVELGVEAVILGHSERAPALRRDRRGAGPQGAGGAGAPGWADPLRRRDARRRATPSETEAVLRAPAAGRPRRASTTSELADVVIAYEPIWAIGTGRTATPEQAAGGDRLHPRRCVAARGGRGRRGPDPLRRLGQARQRRRAARPSPTSTAALVGGASLDPDDFAAIVEAGRRERPAVPSLALVILDGWGLAGPGPGNAISLAETPVFDRLWERYPHTQLSAQGRDVGLPEGQMGNSEVGHLNLGAGAIVKQDLARIDDAIADGSFFENEALQGRLRARPQQPARAPAPARARLRRRRPLRLGAHRGGDRARRPGGRPRRRLPRLHRRPRHPAARRRAATSRELERWLRHAGRVGTVSGRYYAMDRDRRWERTKLAYDAIVHAEGPHAATAAEAIGASYEREETDEFVKPTVIGDYDGVAEGDVGAALQLPARPGPPAGPGAGRARVRRVPAAAAPLSST